ncbi:MAG: amidohydrolase family protein [Mariniblastus sp.]
MQSPFTLESNNRIVFFALTALLAVVSTFATGDSAFADDDKSKTPQAVVLKNATIHSQSNLGTFVGSVVVVDGKISAIGAKVKTPKDAKVIDLTGCHVTPGLIESRGKLWLTNAATTETNTRGELNINDAIDPWSEDWRELASQGITSVYVQQASTGSMGGYGSVLRVGPHGTPEKIILKEAAAVQASIGTRGTTSKDRYAQVKALEKLLEAAKEKKSKKADDKKTDDKNDAEKKKESEKDSEKKKEVDDKKEAGKDKDATKKDDAKKDDDKKDEDLSASTIVLRRILKKEIPLFVEVHHTDSLKQVLALAKKLDIRIVLDGLSNIEGSSDEVAESGFPIVVGPVFELGTSPTYRKDPKYDWLSSVDAQQPWALGSFASKARQSRLLRVQAATAIRMGVAHGSVLKAVTSGAARILGIADDVGSLAVGKQADIAVFAGDPLDPCTPTRLVMSHGTVTFENKIAGKSVAKSKKNSAKQSDAASSPVALPSRLPSSYVVRTTRLLRKGKFVEGTLTIVDGKIKSVGKSNKVSSDLPVFDLADTVVTPGLVMGISSLGQTSSIADTTESDASHLRAVDAVDPANETADKSLAGGVIHVGISPGSSNTSAGVVGHIRLGTGNYVANPAIANHFVLSDSARQNGRFPASLNGQVQLLNNLFDGKPSSSNVYVTTQVGELIAKEKLANVKAVDDGDRMAIVAANSKLEIRSAIALSKQHEFSAALYSTGQVGDFADQLAAHKFGLVVPPLSGTEYDTYLQHIVATEKAGVPLAFAGESPKSIRTTAALLVSAGLPAQAALLGLTEGGGSVVGMKKTGFSKGAKADFVVWSGVPLNLAAKPMSVIVDGQTVSK